MSEIWCSMSSIVLHWLAVALWLGILAWCAKVF